jgi:hypothetical protein
MQNAKDTFYEVLRSRLAAIHPERTIVLRGAVRTAVVVDENELLTSVTLPDCFHLHWSDAATVDVGELPQVTLSCEIEYETAGSATNGGMDRGRSLAAMDAELFAALSQVPTNAPKRDFTGLAEGAGVATMQTNIWWGPIEFGKTTVRNDRTRRTASVVVMSYQEAGEL